MAKATGKAETLVVKAPNFQVLKLTVEGTAPLVVNRFGAKAKAEMEAKQLAGGKAKTSRERDPKIPEECFREALHVDAAEGWYGVQASGIRAALISACRAGGIVMTRAKLAVFVLADGMDVVDGVPLIRIKGGEPRMVSHPTRNESGVADIRHRPMWDKWRLDIRLRFDADMIDAQSVANLLARAGEQVGICEGRPDSRKSVGMGWGTFRLVNGA